MVGMSGTVTDWRDRCPQFGMIPLKFDDFANCGRAGELTLHQSSRSQILCTQGFLGREIGTWSFFLVEISLNCYPQQK
jgi:hypothetical protein